MYKLSKRFILKKNKSFQTVYRSGKSYANRMMVIYVLPKSGELPRVGFAAGKRLGNAVVRNRVKRLLREVYRLNRSKLAGETDLILMGRQAMVNTKSGAVAKAFIDLSKKAGILAGQKS